LARRRKKILSGFALGIVGVIAVFATLFIAFALVNESRHEEIQQHLDEIIPAVAKEPRVEAAIEIPEEITPVTKTDSPERIDSSSRKKSTLEEDLGRAMDAFGKLAQPRVIFWGEELHFSIDGSHQFRTQPIQKWPPRLREDALSFLKDAAPFLDELKFVTTNHEHMRFSQVSGFVESRVKQSMVAILEMLYLHAIVRTANGEFDDAFDSINAGVRFANASFPKGTHSTNPYSDYYENYAIILEALQEAFPPGSLTDDQLNRWRIETRHAQRRGEFMDTYQEEEYRTAVGRNDSMKRYLSTDGFKRALGHRKNKRVIEDTFEWVKSVTSKRGEILSSLDEQVQRADTAQKLTAGPYFQIIQQASHPDDLLRQNVLWSQAQFEARLDLATLGLLVERHSKIHDAYPAALNELEFPFKMKTPKDVFTGEDYVYQLTETGFILQSAEARNTTQRQNLDLIWRGRALFQHSRGQ